MYELDRCMQADKRILTINVNVVVKDFNVDLRLICLGPVTGEHATEVWTLQR